MATHKWVSVRLPEKIVDELNNYCEENGYTRSEFLRMIIRKELNV
jgi:metal-responsive CopG/Arc/MetJ family transcriptional regulator